MTLDWILPAPSCDKNLEIGFRFYPLRISFRCGASEHNQRCDAMRCDAM